MDREALIGRWVLDPDDVAGFEQLGLHGFEFGRHGDAVMSALGGEGFRRALFCWRLDGAELSLTEVASNAAQRHPLGWEARDRLRLGPALYRRRDEGRALDPEAGLFLIGAAGLRHGLASVGFEAPADTESFAPLLLLDDGESLSATRLEVPEGEPAEAVALRKVRGAPVLRWALVHDGASQGTRAVVARAAERGRPTGRTLLLHYCFAHGAAVPLGPVDSAAWEAGW